MKHIFRKAIAIMTRETESDMLTILYTAANLAILAMVAFLMHGCVS